MQFKITKHKNGLVIQELDDEQGLVLQEDTYKCEYEAWQQLLYSIIQTYGPTDSRYSAKRIYIRIEPGDKWGPEDGDTKKYYCKYCKAYKAEEK